MTRVIDFDAYRAEQKKEPVELKIGGKTYELPSSLPASLALDMVRLKADMDSKAEIPPEILGKLGVGAFGEETFRAILEEHALTLDELGKLMQDVLRAYTGTEDEDAEGN
jgi:hypothetical protein